MALMEQLKRLFSRKEIPTEARDLLADAKSPRDLLTGLDELITRNEIEVKNITGEIESLEAIESQEIERVRSGELAERSKNNVLRKIKRLRKQMDNLDERQQIYNRNINLQIHLVGKIQALDAMELRGVDEERIDDILADYEEELSRYQSVIESEEFATGEIGTMLDDTGELSGLEAEILGDAAPVAAAEEDAPASPATTEPAAKSAEQRVEAPGSSIDLPADSSPATSSPSHEEVARDQARRGKESE